MTEVRPYCTTADEAGFPEAPEGYYWQTTLVTDYNISFMVDETKLVVYAMPLDREDPEARLYYCALRPDLEPMKLDANRVQHLARLECLGARQILENMTEDGRRGEAA